MSGVEAVGILLNVLPLLVTAAEHYEDALRPFIRYRNFSSRVQMVHDDLEAQRTIFRAECILLLVETVSLDRGTATNMLSNPSHPMWMDKSIQEKFQHQLGSLGYSCESVMSKLNEKLRDISKSMGELSSVSSLPAQKENIGDRMWRHRVKKKLQFAISDVGIRRSLEDVKLLNKTFLTLSGQVIRLESTMPVNKDPQKGHRSPQETHIMLRRLDLIRKASHDLYQALSQACNDHSEHLARFCLKVGSSQTATKSDPCQVQFSLAYECTGRLERTSWFEIDSTVMNKQSSGIVAASSPRRSFCDHLETGLRSGTCECTLSETTDCKHLARHPSSSLSSWSKASETSLVRSVLPLPGPGRPREMPQFQRLELARILALAVLQYRATPWLEESWSSGGIYLANFIGSVSNLADPDRSPFFMMKIPTNRAAATAESGQVSGTDFSKTHLIPNMFLFRLGVMLLELAYCSSFDTLRQSPILQGLTLPPEETAADFVRARILADDVGTSLGVTFAGIVKKCLRCDFGCGDDLKSGDLKARLYEDVVCKLEDLEDGFRKLQAPSIAAGA